MWTYNGKEFKLEDIPFGAVGFIYRMDLILDGKSYAYIGKKNFFSVTKKRLPKKDRPSDKRLKDYTIVHKPNYENYYSSNLIIKEAAKEGVLVKRTMLEICYSKTELTYKETKHLFLNEVLEREDFLNSNILGKFYKK
jgi:hypothetical protein